MRARSAGARERFFSNVQKGARGLFAASKPTAPWWGPKTSLIIGPAAQAPGKLGATSNYGGLGSDLGPERLDLAQPPWIRTFATSTSLFRFAPRLPVRRRRKRPYLFCLLLFSRKRRRNQGRTVGASAKLTITQNDYILDYRETRNSITDYGATGACSIRVATGKDCAVARLCDSGSRRGFRRSIAFDDPR